MAERFLQRYFVQYLFDADPKIRKTFSVVAEGGIEAALKVCAYCDENSSIFPEGNEKYTSRVRLLRKRDKVQYVVPTE